MKIEHYPKNNFLYYCWHWQRGKHSNIPACCRVWFFVRIKTGWVWLISTKYTYPIWRWLQPNRPEAHEYIRCPICAVKGQWNDLHVCTNDCHGKTGASKVEV